MQDQNQNSLQKSIQVKTKPQHLTFETAVHMMRLLQKKSQLENQKIATRERDQELAKIRNVLPAFFTQHGAELVHAYLTLVQEYIPLRDGLIPVVIQAQAIMERAARQAAVAQQEQQEPQEEKGDTPSE